MTSPENTGIYPPRTHLFLDDFYISRMDGVRREIVRPTHVSGEAPILRSETPWEGNSIVSRDGIYYDRDEQCFKCWYACHDPKYPDTPVKAKRRWCYATSKDGVHWQRPPLGLVEFNGSTNNPQPMCRPICSYQSSSPSGPVHVISWGRTAWRSRPIDL